MKKTHELKKPHLQVNQLEFDVKETKESQRTMILNFFIREYPSSFTPHEVQKKLNMYYCPLTSIRRAITRLHKESEPKLLKNPKELMRNGYYGTKNHTWIYNAQL